MSEQQSATPTNSVTDWAGGIVAILDQAHEPAGTGFVVQAAPPLLVTCAHVLAGAGWPYEAWEQTVTVRFRHGTRPRRHTAHVLAAAFDAYADVALLRLTGPLPDGVRPLPLAASDGSDGAAVLFFGHPRAGTRLPERFGAGQVLGLLTEEGVARLQIRSEDVTHGYSGGPVWHIGWQRVVGMVQAGAQADARVRFATPAQALARRHEAVSLAPPAGERASPLDKALTRLAALPLDTVPEAAPALPRGSYMPLGQNPLFVGREAELKNLAALMKEGRTAAIATGIGGIGKSQLASAFVHRYGPYFAGGVFWLSLADPDAVAAQVALCGGVGGMNLRPDFDQLELQTQVDAVLAAWQSPLPRLLVFDNCEDVASLKQWRPATGGSRVLVTSRQTVWPRSLNVTAQPVVTLARAESVRLLGQHRPDADRAELDAIAAAVGDLPLALHLAGSFLETYAGEPFATPAALLAQLRTDNPLAARALTGTGATPSATDHDLHVARTFAVSWERLGGDTDRDRMARWLMAAAAHFAPGAPIPRALLDGTVEDGDEFIIAEAVRQLTQVGLLEREPDGAVQIHRLVASFVRQTAAESEAALDAVLAHLDNEATRINNAGLPGPLLGWVVHLRHAAGVAVAAEKEIAGNLWNNVGYHLDMIADYDEARAVYKRALAIFEQHLGADHPNVATLHNNLGSVLQAQGDYAGARAAYEQALAIDEAAFGPDHPKVATRVNNLGLVLKTQGDYAGARAAYERALAIDEAAFGPDHPNVATDINNLGLVLKTQGDYEGARAAYARALAIDEAAFGPDHPNVATDVNNLGLVLQAQGDYEGARAAYERALAIDEAAFGPDHPKVAIRVNNLGGVLEAQGDYTGARAAYRRALAIVEAALGPDHPQVASAANNLGSLLQDTGDYAGARVAYERALAIFEQHLGADRPNVATLHNNLGG